jgi:hypothetical protein
VIGRVHVRSSAEADIDWPPDPERSDANDPDMPTRSYFRLPEMRSKYVAIRYLTSQELSIFKTIVEVRANSIYPFRRREQSTLSHC